MPPDFVPNAGQLATVWLQAISFEENEEFDPDLHEVTYSLDVDHETRLSTDPERLNRTFLEISLSVDWEPTDAEGMSPAPFALKVVAQAFFDFPPPGDQDQMRAWTDYNGVYLVWPYLRSWVSMVTALSILPAFTLPTLAVPRAELKEPDTAEFGPLGPIEP